ncbi:MAG: imidazolonepropionase [Gemmatimonadota bacterium]
MHRRHPKRDGRRSGRSREGLESVGAAGDLLITGLVELVDPGDGPGPLEVVRDAFLWIEGGRVRARGPMADLPADATGAPRLDGRGYVALPGLVDSHTHAVFGATREHEFEARLAGATYREIAVQGGGILYSVRDLRGRDEEELVAITRPRLAAFAEHGVTTIEVKSGYGLTTEDELKQLRVVRRLAEEPQLPRLIPTFLGAHAVPPELARDRGAYVRRVIDEMLPAVASEELARFCDVFCDEGAFTLDESESILARARELGLGLKIHAEEFEPTGGAALAARMGAASADHLVAIDRAGIEALARSTTVATLLPGTSFFLRLGRHAPARALADAGARLALATDFNPGSSMTQNLLLIASFGCCVLGLTIAEALRAVTRGGALAVARPELGMLAPGAAGDVALFDVPEHRHLVYHYGAHPTALVVREGRVIWKTPHVEARLTGR